MATNSKPIKRETIQPTLPPHRAMELLRRQLNRIVEIEALHHQDPEIDAWESTTENILHQTFGKPDGLPHSNTENFTKCSGSGRIFIGMPDAQWQSLFKQKMMAKRSLLRAYIEQLEDLSPPSSSFPDYQHSFHANIERVSGTLFRDGHYKQAALEAFILVINSLKNKSGLTSDGDKLINQALSFSGDSRPIVQFNNFSDQSERDEQQGLYFMFKGLVCIRNHKAHTNILINDRDRAYEYLALASLLLRLLDQASVNDSTSNGN